MDVGISALMHETKLFLNLVAPKLAHQEAQSAVFNQGRAGRRRRRWSSARTPVWDQSGSLSVARGMKAKVSLKQICPLWIAEEPPPPHPTPAFKKRPSAVIWANDANEKPLMSSCIVSVSALILTNPALAKHFLLFFPPPLLFFFFLSNILDGCDGRSSSG